ncbi:Salmonella pathogenicity island 2 protein C [Sodalis glossinidius str. 'morsitans']|uniref:Salmonella pathogenicity island 2 protein C n=1 Tax=Sodalis glossinidius (strain morsitans) TaxID=343509 RepID=Q2NTG9_SODGM|nr:SPI-2 type III secretion system protein SpiC [Sodalis glossinidius]BAE74556.1 putative secreted effector protein [Sodalis glossinidius str. 'morsitans']CRL45277.1 Salmonella pathogenicity island 2 protein C [Sodalis glossinidius str. 'morsitans']
MLNKFRSVPFLDNIHLSEKGDMVLMSIDNLPAQVYVSTLSFYFTILLDDTKNLSDTSMHYLTLLLAAHPDIHDYAVQLTAAGIWLGCYYDETLTNEALATELEKQLALARYLTNVVASLCITSQEARHEVEL